MMRVVGSGEAFCNACAVRIGSGGKAIWAEDGKCRRHGLFLVRDEVME